MTSGPLDRPRPQLTMVPSPTRPRAEESRGAWAAVRLLSLAGTLADRMPRTRLLLLGLLERPPWSRAGNGLGSQPENRARGTDADPRSVCLLGGPYPLVGSPNTTRTRGS